MGKLEWLIGKKKKKKDFYDYSDSHIIICWYVFRKFFCKNKTLVKKINTNNLILTHKLDSPYT